MGRASTPGTWAGSIHVRPLFFLFFPLETILDAVRMVTLTIRLIANMFADHAVVRFL
jgi:F0F1-type ATP synthase membrane subunit a